MLTSGVTLRSDHVTIDFDAHVALIEREWNAIPACLVG